MGDVSVSKFGDASQIISNAQDKPTAVTDETPVASSDSLAKLNDSYVALGDQSKVHDAAKTYAEELATLAYDDQASAADFDAIKRAITAALNGAHVSQNDIDAAIDGAEDRFSTLLEVRAQQQDIKEATKTREEVHNKLDDLKSLDTSSE